MNICIENSDIFILGDQEKLLIRLPIFDGKFSVGSKLNLILDKAVVVAVVNGVGNHDGRKAVLIGTEAANDWNLIEKFVSNLTNSDSKFSITVRDS